MTHLARAFSGSIINRFTGSKILARVGQISVAFPRPVYSYFLMVLAVDCQLKQVKEGDIFRELLFCFLMNYV